MRGKGHNGNSKTHEPKMYGLLFASNHLARDLTSGAYYVVRNLLIMEGIIVFAGMGTKRNKEAKLSVTARRERREELAPRREAEQQE